MDLERKYMCSERGLTAGSSHYFLNPRSKMYLNDVLHAAMDGAEGDRTMYAVGVKIVTVSPGDSASIAAL